MAPRQEAGVALAKVVARVALRFITNICPVAEFGLVGQTMHQVDEHVDAADIDQLAKIYREMLVRFFKGDS